MYLYSLAEELVFSFTAPVLAMDIMSRFRLSFPFFHFSRGIGWFKGHHIVCQDAKSVGTSHLLKAQGMHADGNEHGTAQERKLRMDEPSPSQILLTNYGFSLSSGYATSSQETDYVAISEAARF